MQHCDWLDTNWLNRQKITFDNSASAENLMNFPVLVSLNAGNIDFAKIKLDGDDIRFVDADGTVLEYEIENWNDGAQTATVWVKVKQLDAGSVTDHMYIYYNNAAALDAQNVTATWDPNFAGVWHLDETSGSHADSTVNPVSAVPEGSVDQNVAGKIGGADSFFDGSVLDDDNLKINDPGAGSKFDISSQLTLEAWIWADADGGDQDQRIIQKQQSLTRETYGLFRQTDETITLRTHDGTTFMGTTSTGSFSEGTWTHVAGTYDDATDTVKLYINGVSGAGDSSTSHTGTIMINDGHVEIGGVSGRDERGFRGDIDEVRWKAFPRISRTSSFTAMGSKAIVNSHPARRRSPSK